MQEEMIEPEPSTITSTHGSSRFQFAPHDAILEQYLAAIHHLVRIFHQQEREKDSLIQNLQCNHYYHLHNT